MSSKQRKFFIVNDFYTFFNEKSKDICLITHISNTNIIENNKIKIYCNNNDIKTKYIKINLLKKLTKNKVFLNLLSGPTKLFFFKNINSFLNFMKTVPLSQKIYPLSIFFNNNFYPYTSFCKLLNSIKLSTNIPHSLLLNQEDLILKISKTNSKFILPINSVLKNMIISLPYFITNKKIN